MPKKFEYTCPNCQQAIDVEVSKDATVDITRATEEAEAAHGRMVKRHMEFCQPKQGFRSNHDQSAIDAAIAELRAKGVIS